MLDLTTLSDAELLAGAAAVLEPRDFRSAERRRSRGAGNRATIAATDVARRRVRISFGIDSTGQCSEIAGFIERSQRARLRQMIC